MIKALSEIERIRKLGTLDSNSFTLQELNELQKNLVEVDIDLTKYPDFLKSVEDSEEDNILITEKDKEMIK